MHLYVLPHISAVSSRNLCACMCPHVDVRYLIYLCPHAIASCVLVLLQSMSSYCVTMCSPAYVHVPSYLNSDARAVVSTYLSREVVVCKPFFAPGIRRWLAFGVHGIYACVLMNMCMCPHAYVCLSTRICACVHTHMCMCLIPE